MRIKRQYLNSLLLFFKRMKKKRKKTVLVVSIVVVVVIISIIVGFSIGLSGKVSYKNKIAVIPIKGTISTENGGGDFFRSGTVGSGYIVGFLEVANKDKNVKAIILNINSPGGTVVGSKEIADAVKKVDKPVVALIREVGASGAYWIASAADVIVADPLSITGSIGVLGSYLEFSDLFSEYGVKYQRIAMGEFKDLGSPFKNLTERERAILFGKLRIIHKYFVEDVSKNRGRDLSGAGNGLFYLGIEAKKLGLIDELGNKDKAVEIAKKLANITDYELLFYKEKKSFLDVVSSLSNDFGFNVGQGMSERLFIEKDFEIMLE